MTEVDMLAHFKALLAVEEQKFLGMVTRIDAVMDEREKQLDHANEVMELRYSHLNDLRGNVVTRKEADVAHAAIEAQLKVITEKNQETRGMLKVLVPLSAIAGGAVVAIIKHYLGG